MVILLIQLRIQRLSVHISEFYENLEILLQYWKLSRAPFLKSSKINNYNFSSITCNGEVSGQSTKTVSQDYEEANQNALRAECQNDNYANSLIGANKQDKDITGSGGPDDSVVTRDQYREISSDDLDDSYYKDSGVTVEGGKSDGSQSRTSNEGNSNSGSSNTVNSCDTINNVGEVLKSYK